MKETNPEKLREKGRNSARRKATLRKQMALTQIFQKLGELFSKENKS